MFKKVVLFFVVVFCLGAVAQAQSTVDSAAVNSLPPLTEKELAKIKKHRIKTETKLNDD